VPVCTSILAIVYSRNKHLYLPSVCIVASGKVISSSWSYFRISRGKWFGFQF